MSLQSVGFLGFGEAAFHIAKGLRKAGLPGSFAYDIARTPLILSRARETATILVDSPSALAEATEVIFSLVTASSAAEAAAEIAPSFKPTHTFVELNSVSPALKQTIERATTNARFVEGAIMAPVPPYGHQVPILLTGAASCWIVEQLSPLGMRLERIDGATGAAAAVKMCRSIVVKGMEALLFECVRAANLYGAEERVFESLEETFPGFDWNQLAGYMIGRVVLHGKRRAHEMEEVAETLRAVQLEPIMSEATARLQAWGGRLNLESHFGPEGPAHYREVLDVLSRRPGGSS